MSKSTFWGILVSVIAITLVFTIGAATRNKGNDVSADETVENAVAETVSSVSPYTSTGSSAKEEQFTYSTDLYEITFDTKGASISSMRLKAYDRDFMFKSGNDTNAFMMYWGDKLDLPVDDVFSYKVDGDKVVFTNTYKDNATGKGFTVTKTFEFKNGEYLFAVDVDIASDSGLNLDGFAYTLAYGPQVGPDFASLKNNNYNYRKFYLGMITTKGTKRKNINLTNGSFEASVPMKWISLTSKYFTVIASPATSNYRYSAIQADGVEGGVSTTSSLYFSRNATTGSSNERIWFYCGPQLKNYLGSYYSPMENAWGLDNMDLDKAAEGGGMLTWLENIIKWCLTLLYKIVRNYGIAIIILTILIKLLLMPLTKKSTQSNAKMAAIQPQVESIKAKYPENKNKQNQLITELYQKEGINPMGGCLPLLIQFPILIAFYGLLNKHIELMGQPFIPGWIYDLSLPDGIVLASGEVFTLPFRIPLLGNEIHILPFLYTVSMIFSMKYTQNSSNNSQQSSMWFMTYGMPILFFFILYSAPSGLLLYWSVQNALSILQQYRTNKKVKEEALHPKTEEKTPKAVLKYQERMKRLEELKKELEKAEAKKNKKK